MTSHDWNRLWCRRWHHRPWCQQQQLAMTSTRKLAITKKLMKLVCRLQAMSHNWHNQQPPHCMPLLPRTRVRSHLSHLEQEQERDQLALVTTWATLFTPARGCARIAFFGKERFTDVVFHQRNPPACEDGEPRHHYWLRSKRRHKT